MGKVSRQDHYENYKLNNDWLILFAHELEKQGYISNLQQVIQRKKYGTIEEKMADIKDRIGFDLVTKLNEELEDINKTSNASKSSNCNCDGGCGCKVSNAKYEHPEEDVKRMGNILNYIEDMVKAEPHLDPSSIISRCRDSEELGYNKVNIDHGKLTNYIRELVDKHGDSGIEEAKYVPRDMDDYSDSRTEQAEYYSHARPSESM